MTRHLKWDVLFRSSLELGAKFGRDVTELGTLQLLYFALFSQSTVQYSAICVQRTYTSAVFCKPVEGQEKFHFLRKGDTLMAHFP